MGLAGHSLPDHEAFPCAWGCGVWDGQENATVPFSLCCREKDIEMFLESSRSKFIGYTLGRWVQSQPRAAIGGGCGTGQLGGCFCLHVAAGKALAGWSMASSLGGLCPTPGAEPCSCLLPACLFPSSSDTNTVVGLPRPIHESIRTLKLVS